MVAVKLNHTIIERGQLIDVAGVCCSCCRPNVEVVNSGYFHPLRVAAIEAWASMGNLTRIWL